MEGKREGEEGGKEMGERKREIEELLLYNRYWYVYYLYVNSECE